MTTQVATEVDGNMLTTEDLQYAPLEAKLLEWQLPYKVERAFPIEQIRFRAESQVRQGMHIAPKERVEEFALQMKNGAVFPPVIIRTPGHVLIDGNTRIAAAKRVGRHTFPAIVVDTRTEDMAKILSAAINQMGGERLSSTEAYEAALLMLQGGYPDIAIARELGRDLSQVRRWRSQRDVIVRAEELGMAEQAAAIPRTTLGTLAGVNHDEPFAALTKLFADVRPAEKEAKEMVSKVLQAGSDAAALEVIKDMREEMAPAGPPPVRATRSGIPLVRAACGTIRKYRENPSSAFDPRKLDEELERWDEALQTCHVVLEAIRSAQKER